MEIKNIKIGTNGAVLTAYIADEKRITRDAMLVIPGGGYAKVCDDREGEPIALAFLAKGMNAFVLKYTVLPSDKYQPLIEASLAVNHIKENAETYSVNPDRVFAVGFSAGGHLCATLGTMWHDDELNRRLNIKYGSNKPCGTVLCYPVVSSDKEIAHIGSFQNLLGGDFGDEQAMLDFSAEKSVDEKSCPSFIIHTAEDALVPVRNSLAMADALAKNNIMFELHIYPNGAHGMALANATTSFGQPEWTDSRYERWIDDVMAWTAKIK